LVESVILCLKILICLEFPQGQLYLSVMTEEEWLYNILTGSGTPMKWNGFIKVCWMRSTVMYG